MEKSAVCIPEFKRKKGEGDLKKSVSKPSGNNIII